MDELEEPNIRWILLNNLDECLELSNLQAEELSGKQATSTFYIFISSHVEEG